MKTAIFFILAALSRDAVVAFLPIQVTRACTFKARERASLQSSSGMGSDSASILTITSFLKELLEGLDDANGGEKLLAASSDSWKSAIYEAMAAPASADTDRVATALQEKMSNVDSQFAILMGKSEPFITTFPSDPVFDDDNKCWIECRLRSTIDDDLLVTMGVDLVKGESDSWKISNLQWQDFRDSFYPGLSGREWLRAF